MKLIALVSLQAAGPPDEARDAHGKWAGQGAPAQRMSYRSFKELFDKTKSRFDQFFFPDNFTKAAAMLRQSRKRNPGHEHWVAFSLGASWHDPQAQGKIVSGRKLPAGVSPIRTGYDLKHALNHMMQEEVQAFRLSRAN